MFIIDWLNTNSGAVQGIAIVVLVIVTIYYGWQTRRMARGMEEQRREALRPILDLTMQPTGNSKFFERPTSSKDSLAASIETNIHGQLPRNTKWRLANEGVGPAINVKYWIRDENGKKMLVRKTMLPKGCDENEVPLFLEDSDKPKEGFVRIVYQDLYGRKWESRRKMAMKEGEKGLKKLWLGPLEILQIRGGLENDS